MRAIAHLNSSQFPPLLNHVGKQLGAMPTIKRLAGVAPEMDLWECTLHSPLQKKQQQVNKAEPSLVLKPRGDITRNPKQGYRWPQNRTYGVRQKRLFSVICLQKRSINKQLQEVFYVLSLVKEMNPELLGSSKLGLDDIYTSWRKFVCARRCGNDQR